MRSSSLPMALMLATVFVGALGTAAAQNFYDGEPWKNYVHLIGPLPVSKFVKDPSPCSSIGLNVRERYIEEHCTWGRNEASEICAEQCYNYIYDVLNCQVFDGLRGECFAGLETMRIRCAAEAPESFATHAADGTRFTCSDGFSIRAGAQSVAAVAALAAAIMAYLM
ncbi:hypothetical protein H696_02917 [Fonticula alba]|uniref:Folate receptor-like domain-containing protein n=1 Tax=Fonticula alba TaxID=691883 RepID=A0A058Z904_FONAL|nr:hypothetical protein H696_02917 [Fonticula alba]KCV70571.1 hypothetical protein H696_02917 [Fonticula alba]|eukprot:XP_009495087.1 hypothetical protein H696_02917 [Fonticula alba]